MVMTLEYWRQVISNNHCTSWSHYQSLGTWMFEFWELASIRRVWFIDDFLRAFGAMFVSMIL